MEYIQGGADFNHVGKKTKKELKRCVKEEPHNVLLYDTTAVMPSKFNDTADKLPDNVTFNVVGPDPYTRRDWYASVLRNNRGQLVVR